MHAVARTMISFVVFGAASASLGPGVGDWQTDIPEHHGLNAAQLKAAGDELAARLPDRYCFLVAKDGFLVHEQYQPGFSATDTYEGDSAMKTVNALMFGVAVSKGLIDLDKPLQQYGVKPVGNWGSYYAQVTARDILAQESGQGKKTPGKAFTYDSDGYIMHLSYLLQKVTSTAPVAWATDNFITKLGLPDSWYESDNIGDNGKIEVGGDQVNIGGGQMTSCRQLLRAGQLVLNKGKWLNAAGVAEQLVSEDYVNQLMAPVFPTTAVNYGFLTWLNQPATDATQCCGANWCGLSTSGTHLDPGSTMMDDNKEQLIQAPYNTGLALGYLAKYMMILPDQNTVVVTFGNTWGSSASCDASSSFGAYGEQYSLANAWHSIAPAMNLCGTIPTKCKVANPPDSCGSYEPCSDDPTISHIPSPNKPSSPAPAPASAPPRFQGGGVVSDDAPVNTGGGSCSCYCPPDQGFGQCFNVDSQDQCGDVASQATMCPAVGVTKQCTPTAKGSGSSGGLGGLIGQLGRRFLFSGALSSTKSDNTCEHVKIGFGGGSKGYDCELESPCPATKEDGKNYGEFQVATCRCTITAFPTCAYSADPCPTTPFFAITPPDSR